jgi:hypothetical protein
MTDEEAVEEVLRGPFTDCVRCKGTGLHEVRATDLHGIEIVVEKSTCTSCKGHGKWERGDYKQACVITGIVPQRLPTSSPFQGGIVNVHIWDRVLDPSEVVDFYKEQNERQAFTMSAWFKTNE